MHFLFITLYFTGALELEFAWLPWGKMSSHLVWELGVGLFLISDEIGRVQGGMAVVPFLFQTQIVVIIYVYLIFYDLKK